MDRSPRAQSADTAAPVVFRAAAKIYHRPGFFRTREFRGVEGLNLSVSSGEAFGLLGLNGSGKTTTFKLILGLIRPTHGEASIFSQKPGSLGVCARVGYLPELPCFPPFATAEECLRFYGRLSGIAPTVLEQKVTDTLVDVGLAAARKTRVKEMSKGMVQRLGLAQAILHDPDLLVLDEPSSGLDPLAIKDMRDLLASLRDKGKTLLISSHGISEVEKICDRVGIMKEGRLIRLLNQEDWRNSPGGLEGLFVETVRP